MIITKDDIKCLERVKRLKLINSICGIRSVHLIGTFSEKNTNLAIFSSVTHLGSDPALLSFISRPSNIVRRDTISNIKKHKYYTINSVCHDMLDSAHQTSCKYDRDKSEFDACGFQEKYINNFHTSSQLLLHLQTSYLGHQQRSRNMLSCNHIAPTTQHHCRLFEVQLNRQY